MTVVLKFPLERVVRPSKRQNVEQNAEILLFEGVRYSGEKETPQRLAKVDKV